MDFAAHKDYDLGMQKAKQKLWLQKRLIIPVFIAGFSLILVLASFILVATPGKACIDAPPSPVTTVHVVVQKGTTTHETDVTSRHVIGCLADDLKHLPVMPATPVICPPSDGSTYILSFDGGKIVSGSLSACQVVKIQGDDHVYWLTPATSYTQDMRSKLQQILH